MGHFHVLETRLNSYISFRLRFDLINAGTHRHRVGEACAQTAQVTSSRRDFLLPYTRWRQAEKTMLCHHNFPFANCQNDTFHRL